MPAFTIFLAVFYFGIFFVLTVCSEFPDNFHLKITFQKMLDTFWEPNCGWLHSFKKIQNGSFGHIFINVLVCVQLFEYIHTISKKVLCIFFFGIVSSCSFL